MLDLRWFAHFFRAHILLREFEGECENPLSTVRFSQKVMYQLMRAYKKYKHMGIFW